MTAFQQFTFVWSVPSLTQLVFIDQDYVFADLDTSASSDCLPVYWSVFILKCHQFSSWVRFCESIRVLSGSCSVTLLHITYRVWDRTRNLQKILLNVLLLTQNMCSFPVRKSSSQLHSEMLSPSWSNFQISCLVMTVLNAGQHPHIWIPSVRIGEGWVEGTGDCNISELLYHISSCLTVRISSSGSQDGCCWGRMEKSFSVIVMPF